MVQAVRRSLTSLAGLEREVSAILFLEIDTTS